jgi:hypothetical protein
MKTLMRSQHTFRLLTILAVTCLTLASVIA